MRSSDARLKGSRYSGRRAKLRPSLIAAVCTVLVLASYVYAQPPHYKLGRSPTPDEVKAWDIAIGPEGRELPPGRGTVERGKTVYADQCSRCHGATAVEGPEAPLVGGQGTLQ